jgi:hypothetical protein
MQINTMKIASKRNSEYLKESLISHKVGSEITHDISMIMAVAESWFRKPDHP